MAKQKSQFKNKIKDLKNTEFEHPEDFFARAQAVEESSARDHVSASQNATVSQRMSSADEMWIDASNEGYEGQLAVDVFQDDTHLYIRAIIGGIPPEDIEVHLNNDMLTVKGKRVQPDADAAPDQFYLQECYWGGFSRSIILPVDVQNEQVQAVTENGVLTIVLPKSTRPKNSRIPIKEVK